MKKSVVVLGGGLVGGVMAQELAGELAVKVVDLRPERLNELAAGAPLETEVADLSDSSAIAKCIKDADLVISAVPGFLGFETCQTVIESGKDIVDIAFFPEDPFDLEDLAKEKGVTAIVDCGVAPGMSNVLVGYADSQLDSTDTVLIYVGGLPRHPTWPFEYKAVFSPIDVIEEYVRPARFLEDGEIVEKVALTDPEAIEFPEVGTLEAFNTDGLRTLAHTINAPNQKEKTLRYPGHAEKMAILREIGLFSYDEVAVGEQQIRPIDLTAKLLFPMWNLKKGEEDVTVMRVIVRGEKDEKQVEYRYDLLDYFDKENGIHSMARTTGYTASTVARMLLSGEITRKGLVLPEYLGQKGTVFSLLLDRLKHHHDIIYATEINRL